jgi:hypothetical protein
MMMKKRIIKGEWSVVNSKQDPCCACILIV